MSAGATTSAGNVSGQATPRTTPMPTADQIVLVASTLAGFALAGFGAMGWLR